jgi:photosystem II stability/assembly factor-like uncharacterized protein
MKINLVFTIFILLACFKGLSGQTVTLIDSSNPGVSYRGLGIAKDGSIWVSGSKGTIGRSTDQGKSWNWIHPQGYEKRDFRDIVAFNASTAVTLAIDSPGVILKTTDGGLHWKQVYFNNQSGVFLDDLCFQDSLQGICVGDPMKDGKMLVLTTNNGGNTWESLPTTLRPTLETGEAMFAASGSNTVALPRGNKYDYALVTGGTQSRLWFLNTTGSKNIPEVFTLPIVQGSTTTGANALIRYEGDFYIIGGDFSTPRNNQKVFLSSKNGKNFEFPNQPNGYKSGIAALGSHIIAVGTTGVEWLYESNAGKTNPSMQSWVTLTETPYHVVRHAPNTNIFYMAGAGGRIALLQLPVK